MSEDPDARNERLEPDRPSFVLDRVSYPKVDRAHIVPRMYQKASEAEREVQRGRLGSGSVFSATPGSRVGTWR
jgi:hypothetical protein